MFTGDTLTMPKNVCVKNQQEDNLYFRIGLISICNEDILKIKSVKNNSIDLMITSPPYNLDIQYNSHNDKMSYRTYLDFTRKWLAKCY